MIGIQLFWVVWLLQYEIIDIMKSNYFHLWLYFFQHYDLRFKVIIRLFLKLWLMIKLMVGSYLLRLIKITSFGFSYWKSNQNQVYFLELEPNINLDWHLELGSSSWIITKNETWSFGKKNRGKNGLKLRD
jgi:hypothetical protein